MNILLVHPYIFHGGAERVVLNLCFYLNKFGHNAKICTVGKNLNLVDDKFIDLPIFSNKKYDNLDIYELYKRRFSLLRLTYLLYRQIREQYKDCELINAHNIPSHWAAALFRAPIVWSMNEITGFHFLKPRSTYQKFSVTLSKCIDYCAVSKIKEITVLDEYNYRQVKKFYKRIPFITYTGVDFDFFYSKYNKINTAEPKLLQVGYFSKQKNPTCSIQTVEKLSKEYPEVKLFLVGDGPERKVLERYVKTHHLADNVIFLGNVSDFELKKIYKKCDINLFPARHRQTWGLTPFEALCAGRISVVSEYCGASTLLKREKLAIVEKPTPELFAKRIKEVINGKIDVKKIVTKGQKFITKNLTWENYTKRMADIFMRAA